MWKVFVLLSVVVLLVVGCEMARRIDEVIWTSPEPEIEGEPPAPPPIVELVAAFLAASGFGGMGVWLKRQGNGTRRSLAAMESRITALEAVANPHDVVSR